ncbi:hypothetical protein GCM10009798_41060 [Nocardioides panacihumi]|uniref:Uncharacterized protein n=1 Tax=Nocardioides panacihumi TaxID=400774 RepID=A0ABP5D7Z5_9ACTN
MSRVGVTAALHPLTAPTSRVKTSYLVGEQADMVHRGSSPDWLADAGRDFDGFVADRARRHATSMLREAVGKRAALGLERVPLTVARVGLT